MHDDGGALIAHTTNADDDPHRPDDDESTSICHVAAFALFAPSFPGRSSRTSPARATSTMPPSRLPSLAAGPAAPSPIARGGVARRPRVRAGRAPVVASRRSFAPSRRRGRLLDAPAASSSRDDSSSPSDSSSSSSSAPRDATSRTLSNLDGVLGGSPDPAADDPGAFDDDEWNPAQVFAAAIQMPLLWMPAADAPRANAPRPPFAGGLVAGALSDPSSAAPSGSLRGSAYAAITLDLPDRATRSQRERGVSGVELDFALDSACTTNFIVPNVAYGLDVTIVGQSPGGAGATGALLNDAQEMLLGACKLGTAADNQVVLRGLSAAIRPVPAPGVAGVLGRSFMDCFDAIAFDWREGAGDPNAGVTVYQRYDFENAKHPVTGDRGFTREDVVTATPRELACGLLACEVALGGTPVPALIDTGAPRTILNTAAARLAGVFDEDAGPGPEGTSTSEFASDTSSADGSSDNPLAKMFGALRGALPGGGNGSGGDGSGASPRRATQMVVGAGGVPVRLERVALPGSCALEVLGEGDDGTGGRGARVDVGEILVGELAAFRDGLGLTGEGEPGIVLGLDALTSRGRVVLRTTPGRARMRL